MTNYEVTEIELSRIYNDSDFNCRGSITPIDVVDLAKDIEAKGLQFPIAVQPEADVRGGLPPGFDFRIVAGHRRYTAFKVLKLTTIPAMLRTGLSEINARLVNLAENLNRKELNIKQEATAVKHLRELGLIQEAIADELGMSRSWVQVRMNLLRLPEAIQEEAAAGILNQHQIHQIFGLKDETRQYDAVKKIKNAKLRGEKGVDVGKKPTEDPFKAKRRQKTAVQEMMDHMGATIGFGLHTRALAWANGQINSIELYYDIQRHAETLGLDYEIPVKGVS